MGCGRCGKNKLFHSAVAEGEIFPQCHPCPWPGVGISSGHLLHHSCTVWMFTTNPQISLFLFYTARCILFLIIWLITGGRHHFWFLPNLTADVGFIDSFRPLYTHEYKGPKADLKKEEKSESKKQQKHDSEEKSDSEKKEEDDGKTEATRNSGTDGSGGERHSDTDSDRREDDRSQHSSGNGNDFEMITKEELEQQTDEGDCEEEEEEDTESRPSHEKS